MSDPWGKFFWRDWLSDVALRQVSPAARGVWMDMLCVAAQSDPVGHVLVNGKSITDEAIARLCAITIGQATELRIELETAKIFSRNKAGTIYSRRMVRDTEKRRKAVESGKMGGNPSLRNSRTIHHSDNGQVKADHNATLNGSLCTAVNGEVNGDVITQKPEARVQRLEDSQNQSTRASSVAARAPSKMNEEDVAWQRLVNDLNDIWEGLGNPYPMTPTLLVETWREKGYDRQMVLEVAREKLRVDTRSLKWLDGALADRHAKRVAAVRSTAKLGPPKLVLAEVTREQWETVVSGHKNTQGSMWFTDLGPPPDQPGCKAPREILTKHYPDRYPPLHQGGNA